MSRPLPKTDDDLEDAPEAYRRHKALEKRLAMMSDDVLDDPPELIGAGEASEAVAKEVCLDPAPSQKSPPVKPASPQDMLEQYLEDKPLRQIVIRTQEAVLRISVLDIAESEHGIAFFIPKNCSVEFKFGVNLELEIVKKVHKVVYAGGFFPFPSIGFNILSFLRKPEEDDD